MLQVWRHSTNANIQYCSTIYTIHATDVLITASQILELNAHTFVGKVVRYHEYIIYILLIAVNLYSAMCQPAHQAIRVFSVLNAVVGVAKDQTSNLLITRCDATS